MIKLLTTVNICAMFYFFLYQWCDSSFCLQAVFWRLGRPACLGVLLALLPTRRPAGVKTAPKAVLSARMRRSAISVAAGFTCTMEGVWWTVRGACPVLSFLDFHMNTRHQNTSMIHHPLPSLSQRVSSRSCMPAVRPRVYVLPGKFLPLSELWETILAAGPLLQVSLSRGLLRHRDRVPSLSSSLCRVQWRWPV